MKLRYRDENKSLVHQQSKFIKEILCNVVISALYTPQMPMQLY